ncbi:MAG: hypothetical protein NW224_06855 [Leptolyngbyaceae cyanobacterium bins.302]|nr:hypothetical protein [Leptolyngbyaceae cyanobacterium bins.302]
MANCPFCSDTLLRHIRSGKSYWLCRRCRSEILEVDFILEKRREENHKSEPKAVPTLGNKS